ncbi:MAG TPA: ABC transporter permease [Pyrinomonadaceae bacterium]|nr:ABC transporter permease [Pyrinomonadaceae bacterium]
MKAISADNISPDNPVGHGPLIKIRAGHSPVASQLRDAWAHRELFYFLMWRDLKVRYRQTLLGAGWVILQPLLTTIVFTIFMNKLVRVPSDGLPYPLFAYAGLLPWMFFSNSVSTSAYSLFNNSYIVTKVYFPRLIIPAAIVGVRLVDFIVASIVLVGLMLVYGVNLKIGLLLLPLLVAQLTLFTFGISLWFSILNVRYRDIGTLLPVLIQLWMFVSPVVYPSSLVPDKWRFAYSLNPMTGILEALRGSLFGLPLQWTAVGISMALTIVLAVYFTYLFCRWEENLIDVL